LWLNKFSSVFSVVNTPSSNPPLRADARRYALVDAVKGAASQLIVWHHLAFYGPMSDYAGTLWPGLFSWFSQNARLAVQAFLVVGGFLAARSIEGAAGGDSIARRIWRRYVKLASPYVPALLIAVAAAALARHLMTNDSIPAAPTAAQFLAHVALLQGVLGFDSLSAGVWYVAIDFQLYCLLLLVLRLARRVSPGAPELGHALVLALAAASMFSFNRDPAWDDWALYFFGAYGLGAMAWRGTRRGRIGAWAAGAAALAVGALIVDYRSRLLVALLTAAGLGLARFGGLLETWPRSRLLAWLGRISYSVFLIHYPVCLVTNAIFARYVPHTAPLQFGGMLLSWIMSLAAGALLCRFAERRD
jgi:peptidoglycan/LPS O-acetylase OafA/YrhL